VAEAKSRITTLSLEEARARHGKAGVVFVDLRDVRELEREGMIPDAFHCPRGMLEFWIDPDSPYHKEIFASGQEFLDSLPARSPDCLVLDLQMPGLSGLDVQRHLTAGGVRVPTIIITADDTPETRERCLSAGTAAYLCKPFDDCALLTMISRVVQGAAEP